MNDGNRDSVTNTTKTIRVRETIRFKLKGIRNIGESIRRQTNRKTRDTFQREVDVGVGVG